MVCEDGKTAILSFILGNTLLLALIYPDFGGGPTWIVSYATIYIIIVTVFLRLSFSYKTFQISIRAAFLGFVFAIGVIVFILQRHTVYQSFGLYLCVLSFFHLSEYVTMAIANPSALSLSSFMINHSLAYHIAALISWMEFFMECHFVSGFKKFQWFSYFGLFICVGGEFMRKWAMVTAGASFHHIIQTRKSATHVLVTNGPFKYVRHPSYVGWFFWTIGTQLILLNPICIVGYAYESLMFFKERLEFEEETLIAFFGKAYIDYQAHVPTGLPFIKGYAPAAPKNSIGNSDATRSSVAR